MRKKLCACVLLCFVTVLIGCNATSFHATDLYPKLRYYNQSSMKPWKMIWFNVSNPNLWTLHGSIRCRDITLPDADEIVVDVRITPESDKFIRVPILRSGNYACKLFNVRYYQ